MTAYRKVKAVMKDAGISGIKATPKGLRHAFGIACNQEGIQLNMVPKWLELALSEAEGSRGYQNDSYLFKRSRKGRKEYR